MLNILLTGAIGFVGGHILSGLNNNNYCSHTGSHISLLGRSAPAERSTDYQQMFTQTIDAAEDYSNALTGIDVIVHSAARAHIMNDTSANPLEAFREVNTAGTINLANQAAKAGVKRFIFISSIKVNGERTAEGKPFKADDTPAPEDDYGQSKAEAEQALLSIAQKTSMDVVIIRPPLVYGPGVKANFAMLMRLATLPVPIPFKSITQNKRSVVSVANLVDLINCCLEHPKAANQIFLVSDDNDLSTAGLITKIISSLGNNSKGVLIPLPVSVLSLIGRLTGKQVVINKLSESLAVDISKTKSLLNWAPVTTIETGLQTAAEHFLTQKTP